MKEDLFCCCRTWAKITVKPGEFVDIVFCCFNKNQRKNIKINKTFKFCYRSGWKIKISNFAFKLQRVWDKTLKILRNVSNRNIVQVLRQNLFFTQVLRQIFDHVSAKYIYARIFTCCVNRQRPMEPPLKLQTFILLIIYSFIYIYVVNKF